MSDFQDGVIRHLKRTLQWLRERVDGHDENMSRLEFRLDLLATEIRDHDAEIDELRERLDGTEGK